MKHEDKDRPQGDRYEPPAPATRAARVQESDWERLLAADWSAYTMAVSQINHARWACRIVERVSGECKHIGNARSPGGAVKRAMLEYPGALLR